MKGLIIAGIGTGIGKTFISAIVAEALQADYWKPVQSGSLEDTDTDFVRSHIFNNRSYCHPEAYRLTQPMSPHAAAEIDGVSIEESRLKIPVTTNTIVIEPAGGLLVPLNNRLLNIDLIKMWALPVLLVSRNYLGSINHTMLSVFALQKHNVDIAGILFNGESNEDSENFILQYTGLPCIARTREEKYIDRSVVTGYAQSLQPILKTLV